MRRYVRDATVEIVRRLQSGWPESRFAQCRFFHGRKDCGILQQEVVVTSGNRILMDLVLVTDHGTTF